MLEKGLWGALPIIHLSVYSEFLTTRMCMYYQFTIISMNILSIETMH